MIKTVDLEQIVGAFHDCSSRHIPNRVAAAVAEVGEQLADLATGGALTAERIRELTTVQPAGDALATAIAEHDHLPARGTL